MSLVKTTYSPDDVTVLLQDLDGKVPVLTVEEFEDHIQSGNHYAEVLAKEYSPTPEYMDIYRNSLNELSYDTACAVAILGDKLATKTNDEIVLVSLARAGTPVGILLKRYLEAKQSKPVHHYSISIIRGKGLDQKAMNIILDKHAAGNLIFVDGWVGKGAINLTLEEAVDELKAKRPDCENLDPTLAVLSDPASVTSLYGTRQDFLIPSACLNATVSGMFSRTVKLDSMTDDELHGAVYFGEDLTDYSIEFIEKVESYFPSVDYHHFNPSQEELNDEFKGIDEVRQIDKEFNVNDVNKVKPGVGETTRVLLRRVPDMILVRKDANQKYLSHILKLAADKKVPVIDYPLEKYNVVGIIKAKGLD